MKKDIIWKVEYSLLFIALMPCVSQKLKTCFKMYLVRDKDLLLSTGGTTGLAALTIGGGSQDTRAQAPPLKGAIPDFAGEEESDQRWFTTSSLNTSFFH